MAYLVLVRHGQSEWNAKGLWTGLTDIGLSEEGKKEAKRAADALKGFYFDIAFTSVLKRAHETLDIILDQLNCSTIPKHQDSALNERDYGEYTGKNKWEIKEKLGEEEFIKLRRSWNYPIAHGESLKQVYERVIPYYESHILPSLKDGKNILISAHGNSLRALIKYLDNIKDDDISKLEMGTGELYIFQIDTNGKVISKEVRADYSRGKS